MKKNTFVWGFSILVILLAAGGFGYKLYQFISEAINEKDFSAFLFPVIAYFIVGIGFLLLLIWAFMKGHFKDMEAPKYRMMERELEYEQAEKIDEARRRK